MCDTHNKLYVLRCENGKYYGGKCSAERFRARMDEHFSGRGSSWTVLHRPIECILVEDMCDSLDEDHMVLNQMREHGIDNVRGGSHS